jgi:hypothetical protein
MSATTHASAPGALDVDAAASSDPAVQRGFLTRAPAASSRTLIVALELGVLADYLMRANAPGLNITLWCWALLAATLMVTSAADIATDRRRILLLGATAVFAAVPALRMNELLVLLSGVAVLVLLVLSAWTAGNPMVILAERTVGAYLRAAFTAVAHIVVGAMPLLTAEARAHADLRATYRRPLGAAMRGLALSIPVVFVLGALLMQADAAYEALVGKLFQWDAGTIVSHLALGGVFTWLAAAYLLASLRWGRAETTGHVGIRLGVIEGGMVLGVVNLLFLSFMLVQLRYLFGGTEHVLATAGLTYAEYARRGFFELVTVTTLTLPLMVGITAAVQPDTPRERRIQRGLTGALVILLLALVCSALGRMRLYEVEYGWTLPRVHATVFMMWICGCIVWFAATVLRGDQRRFALGSIGGGLALLAALVAVNPAAMVVRANAARVMTTGEFDVAHAVSLRDDAIPALLGALPTIAPTLDSNERCLLQHAIADAGSMGEGDDRIDWRAWNLGRSRARAAVQRNAVSTARVLGDSPCPAVLLPTPLGVGPAASTPPR